MFNDWCTIQSDPGVFTELIKKVGVKGVQVEEVYSMDDDNLINQVKPQIYGFIFLFKWTRNIEKREVLTQYDNDLFFARQIVNNACATQAILSIILNAPVTVEGTLKEFYDFTKELSSQDRGLALSNSQNIRIIHNSFSRPEPFIFKQDKKRPKKQQDVYHFVSYVPFKGNLYQLDGLQSGPIYLGKYNSNQQWIELAKQEIQNRIFKYSEKEIRFNLLMVCEDLENKYRKQFNALGLEKARIHKKLSSLGQPFDEKFTQNQEYKQLAQAEENDPDKLNSRLVQISMQQIQKQQAIAQESTKARERHEENVRRKHNYVPLIINMMKMLAKKNKLNGLIEKAVKKGQ